MKRRWIGTALLFGWVVGTLGCGNSSIADKPNFEPKPTPPELTPAPKMGKTGKS